MPIYLYRALPEAPCPLHPNEKKQLAKKLTQLSENPMHPSLRSKRIQGTEKYFESSVNMVRIIWFYEGEELIVLVDVGHHDVLIRDTPRNNH